MTRRCLVLHFVVQETRDVPLGQTLVDTSQLIAEAMHGFGLKVEMTTVLGSELDA